MEYYSAFFIVFNAISLDPCSLHHIYSKLNIKKENWPSVFEKILCITTSLKHKSSTDRKLIIKKLKLNN